MNTIDRRLWLKQAGLTGALAVLGGLGTLEARPRERDSFPSRPMAKPIRLSSNENPYGPSEKMRQAIIDSFSNMCRYPYAYSANLIQKIAEKEGVSKDHIVLTAGSTEGLRLCALTYSLQGKEVVSADPTFLTLMRYAEQFGAYIHKVPLTKDYLHDLDEMERRVNSNTGLVYICNPNNPTGNLLPAKSLSQFCDQLSDRTIVFADEAYIDYIEEPDYPSMVQWVKKGKNIIVSRTFSKVYGLAGIRIGYLIARPDMAARLRKNMVAFTNIPALAAAEAALNDAEFYRFSLDKNREGKQMIYDLLDKKGMAYLKSHTNFVFFESGREIQDLMSDMLKHGVKIGRAFPPMTKWCRISTGTIEEVAMFCDGLNKVFG